MMGYTHVAVSTAGALVMAGCMGMTSPESFLTAVAAGTVGGIAPDFDVIDKKGSYAITDGSRSRIAALCTVVVAAALDYLAGFGAIPAVIQRGSLSIAGLVAFAVLAFVCRKGGHRFFSHSILCGSLMTACVWLMYPPLAPFFAVGFALHVMLDMVNYPFNGHGVMLLYPKDTGELFAFGWCKSSGRANRVLYYVGIVTLAGLTFWWLAKGQIESNAAVVPLALFFVLATLLHVVRVKSEREIRHKEHARGKRG